MYIQNFFIIIILFILKLFENYCNTGDVWSVKYSSFKNTFLQEIQCKNSSSVVAL